MQNKQAIWEALDREFGESSLASSKPKFQTEKAKDTSLSKYAGIAGRGAVKAIGAVPDLLALPINLAYAAQGAEPLPSFSENIGKGYDYLTGNKFQPQGLGENALERAIEFATGGGVINKFGKAGGKLADFLRTNGKLGYASQASAGAGSEIGKELLPENKGLGSILGALVGGSVPSIASSGVKSLLPNKTGINAFEELAGQPYKGKGEHIAPEIAKLQRNALAEREPITNAYEQAFSQAAEAPQDMFKNVTKNISNKLKNEAIYPETSTEVDSIVKTIEKITSQEKVPLNGLEKVRQLIQSKINKVEEHGSRSAELRALKSVFDEELDNVVETALNRSNEPQYGKVLEQFKNARKLNAEWAQKYRTDNPKDFGKVFVSDMVERARDGLEPFTPESIVNRTFGMGELGFNEKVPYILKELKNHLSPEGMQEVKAEALGRILKPINRVNPEVNDVRSYARNWFKFKNENPSLVKELLDNADIDILDSLAKDAPKIRNYSQLRQWIVGGAAKAPWLEKPLNALIDEIQEVSKVLPQVTSKTSFKKSELTPKESDEEWQYLNNEFGLSNEKQFEEQYIQPELIDKIAYVESGGNPNAKAKTSSASGLLQFTNGTWKEGVKRYGNEVGVTIKDKTNPDAQKKIASRMLADNAKELEAQLGRKPTDGELYMTHFLGLYGAKKLLNSNTNESAVKTFPAEAKANKAIFYKNGKPLTNGELYARLESKIA